MSNENKKTDKNKKESKTQNKENEKYTDKINIIHKENRNFILLLYAIYHDTYVGKPIQEKKNMYIQTCYITNVLIPLICYTKYMQVKNNEEQNKQIIQETENCVKNSRSIEYKQEIDENDNKKISLNKSKAYFGDKVNENVTMLDCSSDISESSEVESNNDLCEDLKYLVNNKTKNYKDLKMFLYFQFKKHVVQKLYTYKIYRNDLKVLLPNKWLNDKIINLYFKMLFRNDSKFYLLTTYFYPQLVKRGYSSVEPWTKNVDLFSHRYIIIPVFVPGHWLLAVVDIKNQHVIVYDSLHNNRDSVVNNIKNWIERQYSARYNKINNYECYVPKNIPRQQNGDDCGVFVIYFGKKYSEGKIICQNTPQNINTYILRVQIMHEICVGMILYESDEKIQKRK